MGLSVTAENRANASGGRPRSPAGPPEPGFGSWRLPPPRCDDAARPSARCVPHRHGLMGLAYEGEQRAVRVCSGAPGRIMDPTAQGSPPEGLRATSLNVDPAGP